MYNPNTDYLISIGGDKRKGNFKWFVNNSTGHKMFHTLVRDRFIEHDYNNLTGGAKAQFKVECILEFHELSNGGWFFRKEGCGAGDNEVRDFRVYRLSWEDAISSVANFIKSKARC